jgi:hypothetical protein
MPGRDVQRPGEEELSMVEVQAAVSQAEHPGEEMPMSESNEGPNPMSNPDQPNGAPMPEPPDDLDEPIPYTVRTLTPHDVARATLTGIACELGVDELRVLVRIGERLKAGRTQYGRLHLATDPRTFRSTEAREELEDALVYFACAWLKAETQEVA